MPPYFFLATKLENDDATSLEIIRSCMRLGSNMLIEDLFALKTQQFKFRFGTQDALISLNDSLAKIDNLLEGIIRKVEKQIHDFGGSNERRVDTFGGKLSIQNYLKSFSWDDTKYSRSKTLIEIVAIIKQKMNENEGEIRKMLHVFQDTRNQLQALTKKEGGNFITRDIGDIVYENDIPQTSFVDTDHFTTLVAVVHKKQAADWQTHYELLVDKDVVPDSSEKFAIEDKDGHQLHTVVLMKHKVDEYIHAAKMKKFTIKRFVYNRKKFQDDQEQKIKLEQRIKMLEATNIKSLETIFGELFVALIHLKIIRIFIDSVLRFGVPPKFCSCIFKPKVNKEPKIIRQLVDKFADPKLKGIYGSKEEIDDAEDFYPFVLVPLTVPNQETQ